MIIITRDLKIYLLQFENFVDNMREPLKSSLFEVLINDIFVGHSQSSLSCFRHFWSIILTFFALLYLGIQLLIRDYDMESRKHPSFNEEDIINIFPVVKHMEPIVMP